MNLLHSQNVPCPCFLIPTSYMPQLVSHHCRGGARRARKSIPIYGCDGINYGVRASGVRSWGGAWERGSSMPSELCQRIHGPKGLVAESEKSIALEAGAARANAIVICPEERGAKRNGNPLSRCFGLKWLRHPRRRRHALALSPISETPPAESRGRVARKALMGLSFSCRRGHGPRRRGGLQLWGPSASSLRVLCRWCRW